MRIPNEQRIISHSISELVKSFDSWMKNSDKNKADTTHFLDWLYSEQPLLVKDNARILNLIQSLSETGYQIDPHIIRYVMYHYYQKQAEIMPDMNIKNRFFATDERKGSLQNALKFSAFRKGISTAMIGITKLAPSDHLSISLNYKKIKFASWNLLSDEHTINFIMDISYKPYYDQVTDKPKLWALFEDFGDYILDARLKSKEAIYKINITAETLQDFVKNKQTAVELLQQAAILSADNMLDEKMKLAVKSAKDAEEWTQLLLDATNPWHEDLKLSLIHLIDIMFSIKAGPLQWTKRLEKLKEDSTLVNKLASHDFLCFQECTNPDDMLKLLQEKAGSDKTFRMLVHKVRDTSRDHCVILFDEKKFALEEMVSFGIYHHPKSGKPRKPCIVAKFVSLTDREPVIVGSIHHSGRGNSELSLILENVNHLSGNIFIPSIILGDYNHQKEYFENDLKNSNYSMVMPSTGTMAGFEYGNFNSPIDGALTNVSQEVNIAVLEHKPAMQIRLPLKVLVDIDKPEEKPAFSR